MYNSQLIQTLRLLSREEMEMLQFFVASPLFNAADRFHATNKLFEYIKSGYPDFTKEGLDKQSVGTAIFPAREKVVNEVEKAMSSLMQVVRQFINVNYVQKTGAPAAQQNRNIKQQLALLRFYSERIHQKPGVASNQEPVAEGQKIKKPEKFFQNVYNDLKKQLHTEQPFSQFDEYEFNDFHFARAQAEREKAFFDSLETYFEGDNNLLNALESLDDYYLLSKLELTSRLLHRQQIARPYEGEEALENRFQINLEMTLQMVETLKSKQYLLSPGVQLYCKLLEFQTSANKPLADQSAAELNTLLNTYRETLPQARFDTIKVMLRSYWTRRYNETKEASFLESVHTLHREEINQIRKNKEGISSSHFQNMMQVAFKLGQTDWAESVIQEFGKKITYTEFAPIIAEIFWALLYFAQKQYEAAARIMPHYIVYGELDDHSLYAIASTADVKLRYELNTLNDYDYGVSMFKATRQHIERQKNYDKARKERCVNFYKTVRILFALKEKSATKAGIKPADLEQARQILDTLPIVEKEWLEEKYHLLNPTIHPKT